MLRSKKAVVTLAAVSETLTKYGNVLGSENLEISWWHLVVYIEGACLGIFTSIHMGNVCHLMYSIHWGFNAELGTIDEVKLREPATEDKKDVTQRSEKLISVWDIKASLFQKLARSYYMSQQPVESPGNCLSLWGEADGS